MAKSYGVGADRQGGKSRRWVTGWRKSERQKSEGRKQSKGMPLPRKFLAGPHLFKILLKQVLRDQAVPTMLAQQGELI